MNRNAEFCGVRKWSASWSRTGALVIAELLFLAGPGVSAEFALASMCWQPVCSPRVAATQVRCTHSIPVIARARRPVAPGSAGERGAEVVDHAQLGEDDRAFRVAVEALDLAVD